MNPYKPASPLHLAALLHCIPVPFPRLICSCGSFQIHPNCFRVEVLVALVCPVLPQLLFFSEGASLPSSCFYFPHHRVATGDPSVPLLTQVISISQKEATCDQRSCQSSLCWVFQPQLTTGVRQVQVEQPGRNTHVSESVFRAISRTSEMQTAGQMYKKQVSVLKVSSLWSRQGMDLRPG